MSIGYKQTQGEFTEVSCHYTICSPESLARRVLEQCVIYQLSHKDLDDLKQSFGQIAAEAYREISEKMCHVIDGHRQNSALARYEHEIPPYSNNVSEGIFIRYMKTLLIQEMNEMHQQCYPTVWFDLQLVFAFEYGGFEPGDSGANLLWLKKEKLLVSFMRHG
ncbi:unnamed protein product [Rhizophagus irregularis]|nr:unnamed protein product [Rhizophagus irregularis]